MSDGYDYNDEQLLGEIEYFRKTGKVWEGEPPAVVAAAKPKRKYITKAAKAAASKLLPRPLGWWLVVQEQRSGVAALSNVAIIHASCAEGAVAIAGAVFGTLDVSNIKAFELAKLDDRWRYYR